MKPITVTVKQALELTGLGLTKFYQILPELETVWEGSRRLITYRSLERRFLPTEPVSHEAPRRKAKRSRAHD
jgi:hypothetical protein